MSSYKFAPGISPNTFVFPTDLGWFYIVSFVNNTHTFKGNNILENKGLSYEISFDREKLEERPQKGKDSFVQPTIQIILARQLELQGELVLYYFICDNRDKKEAARAKLFTQWYLSIDLPGWELFNFELLDPEDEQQIYFIGLFAHSEHPDFESIPGAFEQFLKEDISVGKFIRRQ
jgi:hypothetical protein